MFTRFILAAAVAFFLAPTLLVKAQEHPEHPKAKEKGEQKRVSTADISAGIKENIEAETKKASDGRFHVNHEGKDLALELEADAVLHPGGGAGQAAKLPAAPAIDEAILQVHSHAGVGALEEALDFAEKGGAHRVQGRARKGAAPLSRW